MNQLQEHIQKKPQDFGKQAAEDHRVIAPFEEEVTGSEGETRELEWLLEAFRAKAESIAKLEEVAKDKESILLNLERNTVALQEECANSDKNLKELNDQEANLKEGVVPLVNSLENMKHTLQGKEKNEDEQIQSLELLRQDLSESPALVQSLEKGLQRKEEEHGDLREKLSDAKKQIQQVQNQVCNPRPNVPSASVCGVLLVKAVFTSLKPQLLEVVHNKAAFSDPFRVRACQKSACSLGRMYSTVHF
ncbi:kinesin-like protein KIF20B [Strix aluco]|uniref:kinesin-like protein KIF20B n=1 Tax=Strix aluco TaxID=111821 RepID=UPI003DA4D484